MMQFSDLDIPLEVTRAWLMEHIDGALHPSAENIELARSFCMEKWVERAAELGKTCPTDLSGSCKFTSLFAKLVFGGEIEGNEQHQFNVIEDDLLDLNAGAGDVQGIAGIHDDEPGFIGNPEHLESMNSCLERVVGWVLEFQEDYNAKAGAALVM